MESHAGTNPKSSFPIAMDAVYEVGIKLGICLMTQCSEHESVKPNHFLIRGDPQVTVRSLRDVADGVFGETMFDLPISDMISHGGFG